jgi:hypothetical protein
MASDDLATNIAATRAFLRDCFSKQPSQDEFEMMLSFNMMVPPKVRLGLSNRPLEVDDLLKSLRLPVLVTHGSEDKNSNLIAAEYTAKMIPGAKLSVYQGIGHSPFFEDAPRFNAELAAFVRQRSEGELTFSPHPGRQRPGFHHTQRSHRMDQQSQETSEVLTFVPRQRVRNESDAIDDVGHTLVAMPKEAAALS